MRATMEQAQAIRDKVHKYCNTDPKAIQEADEFFDKPIIAVRTVLKKSEIENPKNRTDLPGEQD